ncbi:MAG: aminopeptidase P family protein [Oscillospiraceae bacterium]|jgi:Xaa-Pro aminopeptidase|nr:aminopeptidase P family protein [Oscillospiraceae bacterium]
MEEIINGSLLDTNQAALITSEANRRYVTGFKSSAGVAVITKDRNYFLTDSRYYEKAAETVKNFKVVLLNELKEQLEYIFIKHRIETVSVENRTMTLAELEKYKKMFPQLEFDSTAWFSDIITKKRMIKSDSELKKIETAQRLAERAFEKLLTKLKAGITEKQVAAVLNYYMLDLGADGEAFPTIAASGKNSAVPHAQPTDKPLETGEFLIIDFGAVVDGYNSDMTRTVVIGRPNETMKRVYDAVWSANSDALKAVRADVTGKLLDNVARSTLQAWGYESFFGHGLGHGVGLEIHEAPTLSAKSDSTLKEGMVFTIEPGVYIPHKFGVRIEDMAVVTKNGCINLTKTPKTLIFV